MATKTETILDQFLNQVAKEIKAQVPKKFGDSLEVEVDSESGRLLGVSYFSVLEFGRGPTKAGARKGSPTLLEEIKKWIQKKNLNLNPYAVTRNIHKFGTVTFRLKQRTGIISSILSEIRINSLVGTFGDKFESDVRNTVI